MKYDNTWTIKNKCGLHYFGICQNYIHTFIWSIIIWNTHYVSSPFCPRELLFTRVLWILFAFPQIDSNVVHTEIHDASWVNEVFESIDCTLNTETSQNKTTYFRAADIFDYFLRRKLCDERKREPHAHLRGSQTLSVYIFKRESRSRRENARVFKCVLLSCLRPRGLHYHVYGTVVDCRARLLCSPIQSYITLRPSNDSSHTHRTVEKRKEVKRREEKERNQTNQNRSIQRIILTPIPAPVSLRSSFICHLYSQFCCVFSCFFSCEWMGMRLAGDTQITQTKIQTKKQTDSTEQSKIQRNIERSRTETNKQTQFPNESIEKTTTLPCCIRFLNVLNIAQILCAVIYSYWSALRDIFHVVPMFPYAQMHFAWDTDDAFLLHMQTKCCFWL